MAGTTSIAQSIQPKLMECTNGYYAVAGTFISGGEDAGTPYDIGAGVERLLDPEAVLQAYRDNYRNAYARTGLLVESHLGEAKAELTMLVEDRVKVLEMNHGAVSQRDLPYDRFTCSTPRDFTGPSAIFQQILDLIHEWANGHLELETSFVEAWSLVLPHTQLVSSVFDVGIHVNQTRYRKFFSVG